MKKMTSLCLRVLLIIFCLMPQKTDNFPFISASVALISLCIGTWYIAKKYNISWEDAIIQIKQQFRQQNTCLTINNQITIIEYKPTNNIPDIEEEYIIKNTSTYSYLEANNEEKGTDNTSINSETIYGEFYNANYKRHNSSDDEEINDEDLLQYSNEQSDYSEKEEENKLKELETIDNKNLKKKNIEEEIRTELISLFSSVGIIQQNLQKNRYFVVDKEKVSKIKNLFLDYPAIFRSLIKKNNFLLIREALERFITDNQDKNALQAIVNMCLPYKLRNHSFDIIYQQLLTKKK